MKYQLPKLDYAYDALEPSIDAKTMEIHYTKHHQVYINNLNDVLGRYPLYADNKLEDLIRDLDILKMDEKDKIMLQNNGGGHLNHSLFWKILGPKKDIDQALKKEIIDTFDSYDQFKVLFSEVGMKRFGSGWVWLVRNDMGKLEVYSLPNQDSPYMKNHTPILALDVWEHAYYLKYQNRRAEYIQNWWTILKLI